MRETLYKQIITKDISLDYRLFTIQTELTLNYKIIETRYPRMVQAKNALRVYNLYETGLEQ